MERPTCKTCPYWNHEERKREIIEEEEGDLDPLPSDFTVQFAECRRNPPFLHPQSRYNHMEEQMVWPELRYWQWCGEHPDFPAYIASLKNPDANDDSSPHGKLRTMLKSASPEELKRILKTLTERESEIIKLSFGLAPYVSSYERSEIARIFKITRERARHIEDKAVKILIAQWIRFLPLHIDTLESH